MTAPVSRDSGYKFQTVLTNNRLVYNPDNGVITIPETGIWALTISVEVNRGFDSLYVIGRSSNPRIYVHSGEDTSSSLVVLTLSFGDKLHWYSSYKSTILSTRSSISGWLIGPSKFTCTKGTKGDIEKPINNTAYTFSYSIVFIISNFETIFDKNIVNRLKGKNIWSHNTGGKEFYICTRKIITDYESRSSLILKIVINLNVVWCHRCYICFVKQTIFKVFYFLIKKNLCLC